MKNRLLLFGLLIFSLTSSFLFAQVTTEFDTVSIYNIQYVQPESLAVGQDDSPFTGDTVVVEGIVATGPRSLWAGARWSFILVGEEGGTWNGVQIIQHDTTKAGTNVTAVRPGYKIKVTGLVEEFSYGVDPSHTQLALLTDPPVPVELTGFGYEIPAPTEVTCAELQPDVGEPYESTFIIIRNATIVNNNMPGDQMLITDATGQLTVDEWNLGLHDSLDMNLYEWPPNGTNIDIMGHLRSNANGTGYEIGPRSSADIIILTNPPLISNVIREPAAPTANDDVVVSAKIYDTNGTIDHARLNFKVGNGPWQLGNMSGADSIYTRTIPKQPDGTMVEYFIKATDNDGDWSMMPGDTSSTRYFYIVRDAGLTIKDLQWTPFVSGDSPYLGYKVTVSGVVTASPDDILGDYIIQSSQEPWSGIWVNDAAHTPHRGDLVQVTGTVEEDYNLTRINFVTEFDSLGTGNAVEPLQLTTGEVTTGSPDAESYEGMLMQFDDVIVSDPFPDAPNNYGEIEIDDGTGGYRVDDNGSYSGNYDSTFALNDRIETIRGIGWFSFYNYKLKPRDSLDVIGHFPASVKDANNVQRMSYQLHQNYPNPFNPATTIHYQIGQPGFVKLTVFNVLGQKIKTLVDQFQPAGSHFAQWNGFTDAGQLASSGLYFYKIETDNFIKTKKMLLLH